MMVRHLERTIKIDTYLQLLLIMKGTDHFEDMRVDEGIILKWILKWVIVCRLDSFGLLRPIHT